ncbi:transmembrane protein, putative (macronuclear) [Tetrahymena thermophila SB210]|uniref:Transmembrane protein, putative n=1 Tax=Tetrahymena thermophila (strain SB210) TaxID=312017 RepID=Q22TJ8_TETTS|nr:transmembrane protein, putative [Tetrahymena thermophila SB210]EAR88440.2 transmembrane protein, putative [Tetrahymena thermophila SB210]|eukprot:XP_001008685.2 transmembrane protein, putative [Tetrahymena thermophila SB210]
MFIIQNKQEQQKKSQKNNQKYLQAVIKATLIYGSLKVLAKYFAPAAEAATA